MITNRSEDAAVELARASQLALGLTGLTLACLLAVVRWMGGP